MGGWDKNKVSAIVGILLSALVALAAVYGYDVKVIQPRASAQLTIAAPAQPAAPAEGAGPAGGVVERGVTGFNDLAVDSVTAGGQVAAGSLVSSGNLVAGSKAITLTAGLSVTPSAALYILSSTGAVSMTLAAPAASGQVLYLYGDDANTITVNDANIYTTDGNAVTLGQYDLVEFFSVGAKWVHVAKSANS